MRHWYSFVLGFLNGAFCWQITRYYLDRHPYRYECKKQNCNFKCSGTEMEVVDRLASNHEENHRREL